ncbi:hypothetical protein OSTOST_23159 [Ostertagia ostertagi]
MKTRRRKVSRKISKKWPAKLVSASTSSFPSQLSPCCLLSCPSYRMVQNAANSSLWIWVVRIYE